MKKHVKEILMMGILLVLLSAVPAMAAEKSQEARLNAPESVRAESYSYSKIRISWDEAEGADGYIVYRADSKNGTYRKVYTTDSAEKNWYINTNRPLGKTCWYRVCAYRKEGTKNIPGTLSEKVSASAALSAGKITEVTYQTPHRFQVFWKAVDGASGYQLQVREKGESWKSGFCWEESGQVSRPVYDGTSAVWSLYDGGDYEFRVRAFRLVDGKKVYGAYSKGYAKAAETSAEDILSAMTEYIRQKYPDYQFYDTDLSGQMLTPENGSWGFTWSHYVVSKYEPLTEILGEGEEHGLKTAIDQYIAWAFTSTGDGSGYGCPYVREVNGQYQIWMLF